MNKEIIGMVMRALNGAPTVAKSKVADEVENALEKQIPKKPILRKCDNADCPCCGHSVNAFITTYDYYCGRCGQKLDWGESK